MYKLTLEWSEGNRLLTETVSSEQGTKAKGAIRLGRDPEQCDIAIDDPTSTVSRQHIEIFLDAEQRKLCARNLTSDRPSPNPAFVDRNKLLEGSVPLRVGSQIQMGQVVVKVKAIEGEGLAKNQTDARPRYGLVDKSGNVLPYDYAGDFSPYDGSALQSYPTTLRVPEEED